MEIKVKSKLMNREDVVEASSPILDVINYDEEEKEFEIGTDAEIDGNLKINGGIVEASLDGHTEAENLQVLETLELGGDVKQDFQKSEIPASLLYGTEGEQRDATEAEIAWITANAHALYLVHDITRYLVTAQFNSSTVTLLTISHNVLNAEGGVDMTFLWELTYYKDTHKVIVRYLEV